MYVCRHRGLIGLRELKELLRPESSFISKDVERIVNKTSHPVLKKRATLLTVKSLESPSDRSTAAVTVCAGGDDDVGLFNEEAAADEVSIFGSDTQLILKTNSGSSRYYSSRTAESLNIVFVKHDDDDGNDDGDDVNDDDDP